MSNRQISDNGDRVLITLRRADEIEQGDVIAVTLPGKTLQGSPEGQSASPLQWCIVSRVQKVAQGIIEPILKISMQDTEYERMANASDMLYVQPVRAKRIAIGSGRDHLVRWKW